MSGGRVCHIHLQLLANGDLQGVHVPIQAHYGIVPDVSQCRRFDCIFYCHVPAQTRDKGFVDNAYKCYFLGIDKATQAYLCWVIDLGVERISAHVLFDEVTQIRVQISNFNVPVAL